MCKERAHSTPLESEGVSDYNLAKLLSRLVSAGTLKSDSLTVFSGYVLTSV
jgi:hypothetical protein